jgi:hypothetical protein
MAEQKLRPWSITRQAQKNFSGYWNAAEIARTRSGNWSVTVCMTAGAKRLLIILDSAVHY